VAAPPTVTISVEELQRQVDMRTLPVTQIENLYWRPRGREPGAQTPHLFQPFCMPPVVTASSPKYAAMSLTAIGGHYSATDPKCPTHPVPVRRRLGAGATSQPAPHDFA
jgi:hypothetical protein